MQKMTMRCYFSSKNSSKKLFLGNFAKFFLQDNIKLQQQFVIANATNKFSFSPKLKMSQSLITYDLI